MINNQFMSSKPGPAGAGFKSRNMKTAMCKHSKSYYEQSKRMIPFSSLSPQEIQDPTIKIKKCKNLTPISNDLEMPYTSKS